MWKITRENSLKVRNINDWQIMCNFVPLYGLSSQYLLVYPMINLVVSSLTLTHSFMIVFMYKKMFLQQLFTFTRNTGNPSHLCELLMEVFYVSWLMMSSLFYLIFLTVVVLPKCFCHNKGSHSSVVLLRLKKKRKINKKKCGQFNSHINLRFIWLLCLLIKYTNYISLFMTNTRNIGFVKVMSA